MLKGKLSPVSLIILILTSVLLLWGCNLQGGELFFETVEHEYSTIGRESLRVYKPRLVVITKSEDIQALEDLIYPDTLELLEGLDYREYFAITVFQGSQGSTGYDIQVNKIVNQGNAIKVYNNYTNHGINC